ISARTLRANPCANEDAAEELACQLRAVNSRLGEMGGDRRAGNERLLNDRYVVHVERWVEAMRASAEQGPMRTSVEHGRQGHGISCRDALGAARQLAAGDGRLLGLLAWRELSPKRAASQFAPDQSVKISGRLLEQRNPWGGVPGCIYYGDASRHGKV